MIIYRPHKGSLDKAMEEAKEFNNIQQMKEHIVKEWNDYFSVENIVIDNKSVNDDRIGWKDTKYVCTKKFGEQDNIVDYGCPQCIGMCATEYSK